MTRESVLRRSRINVLLLVSDLSYGGAERQVVEIANNLSEERFHCVVCSLGQENPLSAFLKRELIVLEKRSRFDIGVVARLRRVVKERDIHVIHSFLNDANIAGRLCRVFRSQPAVISSERNSDYEESLIRRSVERLSRPWMTHLISNSVAGKEFCVSYRKMRRNLISVVHNGVDATRFFRDGHAGAAFRSKIDVPESTVLVGMIGNFKSQKNHHIFVHMAATLAKRYPNVIFLIVGNPVKGTMSDNEYFLKVERLIAEFDLSGRLRIMTGQDDMVSIYNACDLTVLPSSREGTPNVLLESMACETPVVASHVADNALIIRNGCEGILVDLKSDEESAVGFAGAVGRLLEDGRLRRQMGRAARMRVESEFSLGRLAQKTEDVYLGVLSD